MFPILFRLPLPGFGEVPIHSYGVMLAMSLIVGWYLTLGLAERDGLPKNEMANCYVVTALAAIVGSRVLYVLTNLEQFESLWQVFEFRSGGLVAYGGFLGGFLGSWAYLGRKGIPLLPWADVAVPSLASGLAITRIGCYLYGCDFGKPLADASPTFLRRLGTFPHWPEGTVPAGHDGSPAWVQHVTERGLDPSATHSLAVHPTQLYESATGLALLGFLLWARGHQRFRGQIFLWFTLLYGAARFALEMLRDDVERGDVPPALAPHVLLAGSFALFAIAYAVGVARVIGNPGLRLVTQVVAFVPAVWTYLALRPDNAFATVLPIQLSTSQAVGLVTGVAAAAAFGVLLRAAEENPRLAMAMPDFSHLAPAPEVDEEDEDEAPASGPKKTGAKTGPAEKPAAKEPAPADDAPEADGEAEAGGARGEDEEVEPAPEASPAAPRPAKKKGRKKAAASQTGKAGAGKTGAGKADAEKAAADDEAE